MGHPTKPHSFCLRWQRDRARGESLALQWPALAFESGSMNLTKSLEQTKAGLRVKCTKSDTLWCRRPRWKSTGGSREISAAARNCRLMLTQFRSDHRP